MNSEPTRLLNSALPAGRDRHLLPVGVSKFLNQAGVVPTKAVFPIFRGDLVELENEIHDLNIFMARAFDDRDP